MDLIQDKKMEDDKGTRKSTQHAKSTHGGEAGDTPCETRQFNLAGVGTSYELYGARELETDSSSFSV